MYVYYVYYIYINIYVYILYVEVISQGPEGNLVG